MTTNFQQSPYLRDQRKFPNEEIRSLSKEMDLTYIDIASKVNDRTIGTFSVNVPIVTGEAWYFQGGNQKQQTLRRVYSITGYSPITHNIDFTGVSTFTVIRGIGFDGTNYFPLPFVNAAIVTSSVEMFVTPTQIVFVASAGSPQAVSGFVLLEWLSVF